jgi:hypothetical protein
VIPRRTGAGRLVSLPDVVAGAVALVGIVHIGIGLPVLRTEVAAVAVLFGTARWGSRFVAAAGGLSIPVGAALTVRYLNPDLARVLNLFASF